MEKDVKEMVEWLEDTKGDVANLWGMDDVFQDPKTEDKATLLKIFTEPQLRIIKQIVRNVINAFDFHDKEQDDSHADLREDIKKSDAKLRNHRHELGKNYSAKAEF